MQKISHITRHQAEDGSIFQVHHFEGIAPHDHLAQLGKVFKELADGRVIFCGGCEKRILVLPELKEAIVEHFPKLDEKLEALSQDFEEANKTPLTEDPASKPAKADKKK